jgi:hypothetical protein
MDAIKSLVHSFLVLLVQDVGELGKKAHVDSFDQASPGKAMLHHI